MLSLTLAFAPAAGAPASLQDAPRPTWPHWRGPAHDGVSHESNWLPT